MAKENDLMVGAEVNPPHPPDAKSQPNIADGRVGNGEIGATIGGTQLGSIRATSVGRKSTMIHVGIKASNGSHRLVVVGDLVLCQPHGRNALSPRDMHG